MAEANTPRDPNRLIREKSPYLLQHAYNPVDWYPWGEEAFEKAKKEDKPIFLSIGYSTCHWCHVMEEESFSNPAIAAVMNRHFVSIKVDREERPDVDQVYMTAVQTMTGSGGWPLNVFLTPDLKPFYGGTYFPPEDRWGRPGLVTVLNGIADKWRTSRGEILQSGESLASLIRSEEKKRAENRGSINQDVLNGGYQQYRSQFDSRDGGFGGAPKFPRSHGLSFLLRFWKRNGDSFALQMVEKTLQEMSRGGIHDHIGGGFHRYSTDAQWRVPHFEKMLYDQAILSKSYLEAYQATGEEEYARTARDIFEYVLRDLTDSGGAFYSAEDADSASDPGSPDKKSEGAFYLWRHDDLFRILGDQDGELFSYLYGVLAGGNVANDPRGEFKNGNILYLANTIEEASKKFNASPAEIVSRLEAARKKLFDERERRLRPHLDDKILADWNGLMISSLAFGSRALNNPRYREAAQRAADFILNHMIEENGRLLHRYREGEAVIPGFIEDYAFFSNGLLDLYEATFEVKYLEAAQRITKEMIRLFWDESGGGFFFTAHDAEKLIAKSKELYDGALPSGNSVAALSLLRLGRLTMDREMERYAEKSFNAFSSELTASPYSYPQMLIAFDFAVGPSQEIVIAGDAEDPGTGEMIRAVYRKFLPNKVVVLHPQREELASTIEALAPFVKEQVALSGKPTVYVCENYVCNLPVVDVVKLEELLSERPAVKGKDQ
ncbi:MAG: thioredoxin domain-containing protein [Candidatus Omnitrophica bacterium]|nr:thioredoxin domain-containing protein [Candidatus Omnitrophota bacterium]